MTSARPLESHDVIVVGAGVIGLTVAVCLAERGQRVEVRTDREPARTTSAVASAMIGPMIAAPDSLVGRWEKASVEQFTALAGVDRTGVMIGRGRLVGRDAVVPAPPGDLPPCDGVDLPAGFAVGYWATLPLVDMVTCPDGIAHLRSPPYVWVRTKLANFKDTATPAKLAIYGGRRPHTEPQRRRAGSATHLTLAQPDHTPLGSSPFGPPRRWACHEDVDFCA